MKLSSTLEKVEPHDLIVLAPAREIEAEYRMVAVRGNGVVAASRYFPNMVKPHSKLAAPGEVISSS